MIILHHYDASPFSEKIRLILGFKKLKWQSVIIPVIAPKPDLTPLTGGYRKTPVMQIGADIFCDTDSIVTELEHRFPEKTLFPKDNHGQAMVLNHWVAQGLFFNAARYAISSKAETLPIAFHEDRAQMFGTKFDIEKMKMAGPHYLAQLCSQLNWLDQILDRQGFFTGEEVSYADFSIYHPIWFLRETAFGKELSQRYPKLSRWFELMTNFGHGERDELESEQALLIAKKSHPEPVTVSNWQHPSGLKVGMNVSIKSEFFGQEAVLGKIVRLSDNKICLLRKDEHVGEIHVHFPTVGYVVSPV